MKRDDVKPLETGLYDEVVTERLSGYLAHLPSLQRAFTEPLDPGDSHELLAQHVYDAVHRALRGLPAEHRLQKQLELCNAVLATIRAQAGAELVLSGEEVEKAAKALIAVVDRGPLPPDVAPERPVIPLSSSALLVNAEGEPTVGRALATEIVSADAVDLLCAFVQWNGVRILAEPLRKLRERGARLRVITTTYMGATQRKALDFLVGLGAEIKVAYETPPARTKLHAKAWLFHRRSGYPTAYIGSSNLSHSALVDGLEWNVRLSHVDAGPILDKFRATFEGYWEDETFEPYDPARDAKRFDDAVKGARPSAEIDLTLFDLRPYPHQREILEALTVERERHGRWRNLVVAATGTGKTVVAALDYKRLREKLGPLNLLFVAHRQEILRQSRATYRAALKDGSFGELYVDGHRPDEWKHVFASVQSLSQLDAGTLPPDHFQVVVIDEFHHAAAATYRALLERVRPRVLLGLTATPERADGQDVRAWFGGRFATELRLWEALDQRLLSPFQYFGVHDDTDLSGLSWKRGSYLTAELENLYSNNDLRASKVLATLRDKAADVGSMRALGFCVSVAHARFMAERFTAAGVPSVAISADTDTETRLRALRDLRDRRVNVVFAVDLFNEGVDVPEVDTVLFLRPTESATVFLQQLGRGLRLAEGKTVLTVFDFIGQQHRRFRFDRRYRALLGATRTEIARQVENDFPFLPAGCHIQLDRVAREIVLHNVRESLQLTGRDLARELRELGDVGLARFLEETGLEPEDLYRGGRTWSGLRRAAGLPSAPPGTREDTLSRAVGRLVHIDDQERTSYYREILARPTPPLAASLGPREERLVLMLLLGMFTDRELADRGIEGLCTELWAHEGLRLELIELLGLLEDRARTLPLPFAIPDVPLWAHCRYSRNEALAAFGKRNPGSVRQGVHYDPPSACDLFFVTLKKTEKEYSPSTMYRDYPLSPHLFHWESQSMTTQASPTGQRYIHHAARGSQVLLFVREAREGPQGTSPYVFLGPATYVRHEGERPMAITWRLHNEMPAQFFMDAKAVVG